MKHLNLKTVTTGMAALLLMSGIFAGSALAAATPKPVITSPSTKSCVVGAVCSYTITATNSPTSYNATGLQAWQSRSANVISGTPTTAGTFSITVSATNAGGTGSLVVTFTITLPPARVVVAKSGGDYTTITDAINQTTVRPIVIEVWPGVYTEPGTIYLQSDMHIKGSGRDVTTVKTSAGTGAAVFQSNNLTNVDISGLNVTGGQWGIYFLNTTGTIYDNLVSNNSQGIALLETSSPSSIPPHSVRVTGNKAVGNTLGIYVSGTAVVDNNIATNNGNGSWGNAAGIYLNGAVNAIISGNVSTSNNGFGIDMIYSTATITNNVITDNVYYGIAIRTADSGGTITSNKISNNGGAFYTDLYIEDWPGLGAPAVPNLSFNVFDDISATPRGVGSYNVNSNGDPILVP